MADKTIHMFGAPRKVGDNVNVSSSITGTTLKLVSPKGAYDGVNDKITIQDDDFVAENIKDTINIFGITGNFAGGGGMPDPRFVDNGDGTVSDLWHGLMWVQSPPLVIRGSSVIASNQVQAARGIWATSTLYSVADLVLGGDSGFYVCAIEHTSVAAVTTPWAPSTYYNVGDTVDERAGSIGMIGICLVAHTSNSNIFDDEAYSELWQLYSTEWDWEMALYPCETYWRYGDFQGNEDTLGWGASRSQAEDIGVVESLATAGYAGYNDWRLPTASEMELLIDRSNFPTYPVFNQTLFSYTSFGIYWTSTPGWDEFTGFYVDGTIGMVTTDDNTLSGEAWPVRTIT